MSRSIIKMASIAAAVIGTFASMSTFAADGQIRITGHVVSKTCEISINGAPTSTLLHIDPVAVQDLNQTVKSAKGTSLMASRNMRTVDITLQNCNLPSGKTKVAVSFDSTGYGDAASSTYRNSLIDDVNTMDAATKGVQMGFTQVGKSDLLMDLNGLVTGDYKDPASGAQTYSFETRYVQTAAQASSVVAGDMETVATFSLVYM